MAERADGFAVWPENWPAVQAFLTCATQWRTAVAGLGVPLFIGLDYAACQAVLTAEGRGLDGAGWTRLRTMEAAAAEALNRRFRP